MEAQVITINKKQYAIVSKELFDEKMQLIEDLEDRIAILEALKENDFVDFDTAIKEIEVEKKNKK
ncbi:MAG: hypothetical protein IPH58_14410 [Sphingobacteriales bacterium]|jgi:hypothetical protein|nr:hypothetical protein [Sphingobacteriales bacterium]